MEAYLQETLSLVLKLAKRKSTESVRWEQWASIH